MQMVSAIRLEKDSTGLLTAMFIPVLKQMLAFRWQDRPKLSELATFFGANNKDDYVQLEKIYKDQSMIMKTECNNYARDFEKLTGEIILKQKVVDNLSKQLNERVVELKKLQEAAEKFVKKEETIKALQAKAADDEGQLVVLREMVSRFATDLTKSKEDNQKTMLELDACKQKLKEIELHAAYYDKDDMLAGREQKGRYPKNRYEEEDKLLDLTGKRNLAVARQKVDPDYCPQCRHKFCNSPGLKQWRGSEEKYTENCGNFAAGGLDNEAPYIKEGNIWKTNRYCCKCKSYAELRLV